jgi:hypothetical protein
MPLLRSSCSVPPRGPRMGRLHTARRTDSVFAAAGCGQPPVGLRPARLASPSSILRVTVAYARVYPRRGAGVLNLNARRPAAVVRYLPCPTPNRDKHTVPGTLRADCQWRLRRARVPWLLLLPRQRRGGQPQRPPWPARGQGAAPHHPSRQMLPAPVPASRTDGERPGPRHGATKARRLRRAFFVSFCFMCFFFFFPSSSSSFFLLRQLPTPTDHINCQRYEHQHLHAAPLTYAGGKGRARLYMALPQRHKGRRHRRCGGRLLRLL